MNREISITKLRKIHEKQKERFDNFVKDYLSNIDLKKLGVIFIDSEKIVFRELNSDEGVLEVKIKKGMDFKQINGLSVRLSDHQVEFLLMFYKLIKSKIV